MFRRLIVYSIAERCAVDDTPGGGLVGAVSLQRLGTEVFKDAGLLQPGETVTHLEISAEAIQFRVKRVPPEPQPGPLDFWV